MWGWSGKRRGQLFDVLKVYTAYIMPLPVNTKLHNQSLHRVYDGFNFSLSGDRFFVSQFDNVTLTNSISLTKIASTHVNQRLT
jgi:hypothetical protein